jgi:hypothetical protein
MGMHVTEAGEVWVSDAIRPMLWHLTAEQVAAGSGTPAAVPLTPEIPHVSSPDNVEGVVALSETRLVVVKFADGTLYRIDLDPQVPQGRTITPDRRCGRAARQSNDRRRQAACHRRRERPVRGRAQRGTPPAAPS